jgi:hypothetical protein
MSRDMLSNAEVYVWGSLGWRGTMLSLVLVVSFVLAGILLQQLRPSLPAFSRRLLGLACYWHRLLFFCCSFLR